MKITTATAVGGRSRQEDRFLSVEGDNGVLLAIMDGHGVDEVAEFISLNIGGVFAAFADNADARGTLSATFKKLYTMTMTNRSGSMLSVVWIPRGESRAYIAVLGDSPIIIKNPGKKPWLSPEHNVRTNVAERDAAVRRGGIYTDGYIWNASGDKGLQLSRALGDLCLNSILNREPEIFSVPIPPGSVIILASDGLLDSSHEESSAQIGRLLQMIADGSDAQEFVEDALERQTNDNATAIVCVIE